MSKMNSREPIAVIGTACRFPGGVSNVSEYWDFLKAGTDAVSEIPSSRWSWQHHYDENVDKFGKMAVRRGGFLDHDIESFDAAFFDISPREAAVMDPQQRVILELAHEALEHAVGNVNDIRGSQTGVYIGAFMLDNMITQMGPGAKSQVGIYTALSSTMTMISARLSYAFDLKGPSFTLDTACSSSLVAIHQACRGLLSGDCDMAVTGGISIMFRPEVMMMMSKGRFLAPDGRSKTFSADANGYGRGEGGGLVVLKRLSDAVRDGDTIHALIRGSGSNQDGNTDGITVPSESSQAALARRVYKECDVNPEDISYLEAHGTGTPVGDPIEMNAMGKTVGVARAEANKSPLVVGSVKAGIGHLEAAAGVAGFLKAMMVVKEKEIPPQAWLPEEVNPNIDFDGLNIQIADKLRELPKDSANGDLVAINSFGYGGTNAHVVLESWSPDATDASSNTSAEPAAPRGYILNLSGESEDANREYALALTEQLADADDSTAANICASMANRTHHTLRTGITADSKPALLEKLTAFADGEKNIDGVVSGRAPSEARKTVFVFSGMGPQWWAMGRGLYENEPLFRAKLDEADKIFKKISGWSVLEEMLKDEESSQITKTEIAQPANFMLQMGLFELLRSQGIEPAAVVGHSVGEVSSGYASGSLSLEQALTVAYHRSRTQAKTAGTGAMMAVNLGEEQLSAFIEPYEGKLDIAGINSETNTTVSGDEAALDELAAILTEQDIKATKLRVEVPYHSQCMDPILDELRDSLTSLAPSEPTIPLYSTVTGARTNKGFDNQYWCDNVRDPVYFYQAVATLLEEGFDLFIEVGPHPVLGGYIRETMINRGGAEIYLPSMRRKEDDMNKYRELLAQYWANGCEYDVQKFMDAPGDLKLPAYPWQRKQHWDEEHFARLIRQGWPDAHKILGRKLADPDPTWQTDLSKAVVDWLPEHKVSDAVVLPGAAYVEAMLQVASESLPEGEQLLLRDIQFHRALVIQDAEDPTLRTCVKDGDKITLTAGLNSKVNEWTLHSQSRLMFGRYTQPEVPALADHNFDTFEIDELYQRFAAIGLEYGPTFQSVKSLRRSDDLAVATLAVDDASDYTVHPGILDGALQSMLALVDSDNETAYLPASIEEVRCFARVGNTCQAYTEITVSDAKKIVANITLVSDDQVAMTLRGVKCTASTLGADSAEVELDNVCYEIEWRDQEATGDEAEYAALAVVNQPHTSNLAMVLRDAKNTEVSEFDSLAALVQSNELQQLEQIVVFVESGSAADAIEDAAQLFNDIKALAEKHAGQPVVSFITRAAQTSVLGGDVQGWKSSWLTGFRRNAMNEVPEISLFRHIDIDDSIDDTALCNELFVTRPHDEVVLYNDTQRAEAHFARVDSSRHQQNISTRLRPFVDNGHNNFHLSVPERKAINSLAFIERGRIAPGKDEVEVRVEAATLNYKDIAKVLGLLTDDMLHNTNSGLTLGLECAGTVVRVGEGVTEWRKGDQVVLQTADCFQRYTTVPTSRFTEDAAAIIRKPSTMTLQEGSAVMVAYTTALWTLNEVARLRAGESVLIHGGAGGVGLAAIHTAKWLGAKVIATAGTEEKRDYLRSIGVDHAVDSRTLNFVEEIKAVTDGKGVDVVLNSIGGSVATASFDALANFGRFIEIGKNDIYAGKELELKPFDRNIMYTCVDLDFVTVERRGEMGELIDQVYDLLEDGSLPALPVTVFGASEVRESFTHLARSRHTGKVVIDFNDTPMISQITPRTMPLAEDKTILITGGLGGVGLMLTDWCIDNGARRLALLSRSGIKTDEQRELIESLRKLDVEVDVYACDAADKQTLAKVIGDINKKSVLGGVIHAAGVLDDRSFMEMDGDAIRYVANPKIVGAENLHELTENLTSLDLFITISSISAQTGHTRQLNYCLANAYMDGLCHRRRAMGLPASTINLGPVAEAGMAADSEELQQYLSLYGLEFLGREFIADVFSRTYSWNIPQLTVVDVQWPVWEFSEPRAANSGRFSEIVAAEGAGGGNASLLLEISRMPKGEQIETVAYILSEHIADILQMDSEDVEIEASLDSFGIDSLTAVEFQSLVNRSLSVEVSVLSMLSGKSLRDVAAELLEEIDFDAAAQTSHTGAAA